MWQQHSTVLCLTTGSGVGWGARSTGECQPLGARRACFTALQLDDPPTPHACTPTACRSDAHNRLQLLLTRAGWLPRGARQGQAPQCLLPLWIFTRPRPPQKGDCHGLGCGRQEWACNQPQAGKTVLAGGYDKNSKTKQDRHVGARACNEPAARRGHACKYAGKCNREGKRGG